jgi:dihydroorotate dehydrogenase
MLLWDLVARPLLFAMDPEWVHEHSMGAFGAANRLALTRWAGRALLTVDDERLVQTVAGVRFQRPLGLAAGFDKNARWIDALAALGFGSVEVGTLTAHAQPGNDRPRLFRLPADRAIINRMGFNNEGSEAAGQRLANRQYPTVVGVNIGRSRITPNEAATDDYLTSLNRLHGCADYLVVNVSSPNTAGLRDLQQAQALHELLSAVHRRTQELGAGRNGAPPPVFVKIAPDMDEAGMQDVVDLVVDIGIAGIIATNTTIQRQPLTTPAAQVEAIGAGGLSGGPLTERSRTFVRQLFRRADGRFPIIGVGGVMNADDAWAMVRAGATLLQTYTGFIYGGPTFARDIHRGLLVHLDRAGGTLANHVGADA